MPVEGDSQPLIVLKYFFHGIAFSFIMIFLAIVWVFILVALMMVGLFVGLEIGIPLFFVGLAIGILLLFFVVGGLNAVLISLIWKVEVKSDWKSVLFHGIVLFFAMLVASIPSIFVGFLMSDLTIRIVLFVVYCFIDGYVAKNVGCYWEQT